MIKIVQMCTINKNKDYKCLTILIYNKIKPNNELIDSIT